MSSFNKIIGSVLFLVMAISCGTETEKQEQLTSRFDRSNDLLLLHYDCKTDVDDLHSVAAAATLLNNPDYSDISYHAVAGAYGNQDGLYVPPNDLFNLAFGKHWSDAHADFEAAASAVSSLAVQQLQGGGDIWIAEAGQSDFSGEVLRRIREALPEVNTLARVNIIQHSNWNETETTLRYFDYVRQHAAYRKIADGNSADNDTPGYTTKEQLNIEDLVSNEASSEVWSKAIEIANIYNGVDGRYLNQSIKAGGFDFSDFVEVWWILELTNADSPRDFLKIYGTN